MNLLKNKITNTRGIMKPYTRKFPESVLTTSVQVDTADDMVSDEKILRASIASELSAINLYQDLLSKANHGAVKAILMDIIDEEKVHVGEFEKILSEYIDPDQEELIHQGEEEAEDVVSERVPSKVAESYHKYFKHK